MENVFYNINNLDISSFNISKLQTPYSGPISIPILASHSNDRKRQIRKLLKKGGPKFNKIRLIEIVTKNRIKKKQFNNRF